MIKWFTNTWVDLTILCANILCAVFNYSQGHMWTSGFSTGASLFLAMFVIGDIFKRITK